MFSWPSCEASAGSWVLSTLLSSVYPGCGGWGGLNVCEGEAPYSALAAAEGEEGGRVCMSSDHRMATWPAGCKLGNAHTSW